MKALALVALVAALIAAPVAASPSGLKLAIKGEWKPEIEPHLFFTSDGRMLRLSWRKPLSPGAQSPFSSTILGNGWSKMQNASTYGTGKPWRYVRIGANISF